MPQPHRPTTVIVYPASGGGPIGFCSRHRAKHLVKHDKAEWVFHRGELDGPRIEAQAREPVFSQIAIRLRCSDNARRDNPPIRLSVEELTRHIHKDPLEPPSAIEHIVACGPYKPLPGGGSALGLDAILRAMRP
ncbi:MAG: hypothetical protein OWR62_16165 [Sulfobacillus thermotolerans]|nr:hypothetical protein [Sulfobacillus thermotolerans]